MKKLYMFIALVALALSVAACGTTNKQENPGENKVLDQKDQPAENNAGNATDGSNNTNDTTGTTGTNTGTNQANQTEGMANEQEMQAKMDELDYIDFELDIEYADHQDYEADLEKNSNNSVEAKIDDSLNNVRKKGADAFNDLYPLVKQLTINQQTTKEDAIKQVIDVFKLPADYQEFDLEIKFKDGTKVEYEDRK